MKEPKINVIIWKWEEGQRNPEHAYVCKRSVVPNRRFIAVKLNGEEIDYTPSAGMRMNELPKGKLPRGCKKISVDEANRL